MILALACACMILGADGPGTITGESLAVQPAVIATLPAVTLKVTDEGRVTSFDGVALASILERRQKPVEGMAGLRDLSDAVLLVRGSDGYQAAVSATAVLMDPKGERYVLATARDGEKRPLQLVIPGDPKHARWVKDVVAVRLIRLRDLVRPEP